MSRSRFFNKLEWEQSVGGGRTGEGEGRREEGYGRRVRGERKRRDDGGDEGERREERMEEGGGEEGGTGGQQCERSRKSEARAPFLKEASGGSGGPE